MWTNHRSEPAAGTIVPPVLYLPIDARESIDEWLADGTRFWQPPQLAG
ncbi:hypothetical protein [Microbacterium sp. NPDC091662]